MSGSSDALDPAGRARLALTSLLEIAISIPGIGFAFPSTFPVEIRNLVISRSESNRRLDCGLASSIHKSAGKLIAGSDIQAWLAWWEKDS